LAGLLAGLLVGLLVGWPTHLLAGWLPGSAQVSRFGTKMSILGMSTF
jgi:hypothetical protein